MKKILLIISLSLFVTPLFVFADWCSDAGGAFCTYEGHMNCYCSDGNILTGSLCSDVNGTVTCPIDSEDEEESEEESEILSTSSTGSINNPIGSNSFAELVAAVVDWIIGIAMVLAPLVIVYGGFTCMTALDDAGKLKTGKQIILYAILGFLLALIAKSLIDLLVGLAGG